MDKETATVKIVTDLPSEYVCDLENIYAFDDDNGIALACKD